MKKIKKLADLQLHELSGIERKLIRGGYGDDPAAAGCDDGDPSGYPGGHWGGGGNTPCADDDRGNGGSNRGCGGFSYCFPSDGVSSWFGLGMVVAN